MTVRDLAERFAEYLRRDLNDYEWNAMRRRNAAETNPAVCHSHDFTDSNMQMLEAFESVYGRAVDFEADSDMAAIADAWNVAKADRLTAKESDNG